MKFDRIVLQLNTHRLTETDFQLDVTPFHAETCGHLMSAHAASAAAYAVANALQYFVFIKIPTLKEVEQHFGLHRI